MGIHDRSYYRDSYQSNFFRMAPGTGRSMIVSIIIINVVIWLVDSFTPMEGGGSRMLAGILSLDTNTPFKPWLWWKFLTYGFAHASIGTGSGLWHIFGNMLGLFFLGRAIESKLGRYEFLKFYLISIVVSGLVWLLVTMARNADASLVGASGAVTAVVGLFIFSYPKEKIFLMGVLPMPAWLLGVVILVQDLFRSAQMGSEIAGEAHLAGFAFAALYHYQKLHFRWISFAWAERLFSGKPRLKVHNPGAGEEKLKAEGDKILEKVHEEGEGSLTRRERKILAKYSKLARKNRL